MGEIQDIHECLMYEISRQKEKNNQPKAPIKNGYFFIFCSVTHFFKTLLYHTLKRNLLIKTHSTCQKEKKIFANIILAFLISPATLFSNLIYDYSHTLFDVLKCHHH